LPRSKPKTGTASFYASDHRLSDPTRSVLVGLLGLGLAYDSNDRRHIDALQDVEEKLGFYSPAKKTFRNLPGPADYKRALCALNEDGQLPHKDEHKFHQRILDTIEECRIDPRNKTKNKKQLIIAIRTILSAKAEVEARGRPRNEVELHVIQKLRKIFDKHYAGGRSERTQLNGAAEELSASEVAEVHFIEAAFKDADIPIIDNLRRLFMEPAGILPSERNALLSRMADRYEKIREAAINQTDSGSAE
jgi:hypothetical protein